MGHKRWLVASALIAVLLGFAEAGMSAAPAEAACWGYSCHGLNPSSQGCSATSTTTASSTLVVLQNRDSSGCNANWARAELTQQGSLNGDQFIVYIVTTDSRGNTEEMCYPGPSNTGQLINGCDGFGSNSMNYQWTDMVDGTNLTYAHVQVFDSHGNFIQQLQTTQ